MPDNVTANGLTIAGGPVFAADEISGALYPRSKLIHGVDGVNAGDVSETNPLPVSPVLRSATVVSGQVTVGTTAVQLTSAIAKRFRLKAPLTNNGTIFIGPDSPLTAANGYPLMPGESTPPLELANLNVLFAISDLVDQKVAYLGEV